MIHMYEQVYVYESSVKKTIIPIVLITFGHNLRQIIKILIYLC